MDALAIAKELEALLALISVLKTTADNVQAFLAKMKAENRDPTPAEEAEIVAALTMAANQANAHLPPA